MITIMGLWRTLRPRGIIGIIETIIKTVALVVVVVVMGCHCRVMSVWLWCLERNPSICLVVITWRGYEAVIWTWGLENKLWIGLDRWVSWLGGVFVWLFAFVNEGFIRPWVFWVGYCVIYCFPFLIVLSFPFLFGHKGYCGTGFIQTSC